MDLGRPALRRRADPQEREAPGSDGPQHEPGAPDRWRETVAPRDTFVCAEDPGRRTLFGRWKPPCAGLPGRVKNHNLGLEAPYRYGSETRRYLPDYSVLVDDGRGDNDLLRLVVEVKGYRREDAKDKKQTMDAYRVPGVNHLGAWGRWAFAELTDVYTMEEDFEGALKERFRTLVAGVAP